MLYANWPGRFEVLGEHPLTIIDGAHNEDAALQLAKTIQNSFTNQSLTYIIGVLADKEHKRMLEIMLQFAKRVYTIMPPNSRGLKGELLLEEVCAIAQSKGYAIEAECCETIEKALDKACAYGMEQEEPVLAFGSLSYLGQLKQLYTDKYLRD